MKHTNFYDKIEEIRWQEAAELMEALKAHGGKFEWPDDEELERPVIAINPDNCHPNPTDVEVVSASVRSGKLELKGVDKNDGHEISFSPGDVFAGHLSFITGYIPETETVSDVSLKQEFFQITSVCRDDLEASGFDTENIDDSDMAALARKMADDYCEQLFCGSMDIIAENLDFPRKWDKWFEKADFAAMERITGYRQSGFSPEDDYQDFVDACEDWWEKLTNRERKEIYISNTESI